MQQAAASDEKFDLAAMVADLNSLLRLKTTVIGMKMFATVEEMTAIPKIRRPIGGPYHRPDRQHGLAAGLDRRHHRRTISSARNAAP